jgi:hypothetical protein
MAPKYHPTPLSGGDRKALAKELGKARAMANILATRSAEMRAKGDLLIRDRRNNTFKPLVLPVDREERFQLHCRAHDAIDRIPIRTLAGAKKQITTALNTKPTMAESRYLIGTMLDIFSIKAGDDMDNYISAVAFEVSNLQFDKTDWHLDLPSWIPVYSIAHGVRRMCTVPRGESYGRAPPIWEVMEKLRESRMTLCKVLEEIDRVGRSWKFLKGLVDATADSYPDESRATPIKGNP